MNILITGGSGFLGRKLNAYLKKNTSHKIISLSSKIADLRETNSLKDYNDLKFDKIYHLAAWTQAGDFSLYHSGEQWIYNQQINSNVLSWWKKHQQQSKIISIGTSCSYEEGGSLEEEYYLKGEPIKSLFAYGMCKRMLLIGQQNLAKQFGLKYLTVIPSTLYGSGYEIQNKIPHFIFDVIKKIILAKKNNSEVELWGDGFQKRELVHVNDFINQMILLENKCENEIINIGAGEEYEIRYFAQLICDIVQFDFKKIHFNKEKYTGAKSKNLSVKKLKKILPDYKQISLEEGLKETIFDLQKKI